MNGMYWIQFGSSYNVVCMYQEALKKELYISHTYQDEAGCMCACYIYCVCVCVFRMKMALPVSFVLCYWVSIWRRVACLWVSWGKSWKGKSKFGGTSSIGPEGSAVPEVETHIIRWW